VTWSRQEQQGGARHHRSARGTSALGGKSCEHSPDLFGQFPDVGGTVRTVSDQTEAFAHARGVPREARLDPGGDEGIRE